MAQRIRSLQMVLGSNMPSSEALAIEQFAGLNMNTYAGTAQAVTSSATFVDATNLWTELPSGPNRVTCVLPVSLTAAGGIKVTFRADQGLTVSSIALTAIFLADGVAPAVKPIASLGATTADGGTTNTWTSVLITGTVNVTNKGVLQLQFAQSASNAGATTIAASAEIDSIALSVSGAL